MNGNGSQSISVTSVWKVCDVEHLFFLAVMLLQNHSLSEIRRDWKILTDVFSEETSVKQNFLVSTDLAEINFGGQPLFYIFKIYSCCHPFVWLFPLMLNAENTYSLIEKRLVQLKIRETADKRKLLDYRFNWANSRKMLSKLRY